MYSLDQSDIYAGIDIGGTNIKYGIFNGAGEILFKDKKPTPSQNGRTQMLHLLKNIGEILLYFAAEENLNIASLGVGSPGAVNHLIGKVIGPCPNIDDWTGTEIGTHLSEYLNIPVHVDNDVNAMALAEIVLGAGKGSHSVVCTTVGTGIGGSFVYHNHVYHGHNFTAGELGHMTINFNGPECACGNRGCLEAYCSSKYIIQSTKDLLGNEMTPAFKEVLEGDINNLTIKKLFAAAMKNDEIALKVISDTANYLGTGLAGIVNLLNPETVIIGGGITDGGAGFVEKVTTVVKEKAFSSAIEKLKIVKASLGNQAGFIGAGLLGIAPKER